MRVAIYLRVSTEDQATEGMSLAAQEARCRARAEAEGATSCAVIADPGYSGSTLDRPGLRDLLERLDEFAAIYVYDLSRLSRDLLDQLTLERRFMAAGVRLVSLQDHVDYATASGRLSMRVTGAVAQFQREDTIERTRMGLHQRAREGLQHGTPPLGYDYPRGPGGDPIPRSVLEVVPDEARLVRRVYDLYLAGASLREIVTLANAEEWPSRRAESGGWTPRRVSYILHNRAYLGLVMYRGDAFAAEHEPLVSVAEWRAVQERMDRRRRGFGRAGHNRASSYAPLLRCGLCGGRMNLGQNARWTYYRCADRYLLPAGERHAGVNTPRPMVDAIIDAWTRHLLTDGVLAEAAAQVAAEEASGSDEERAEVARALEGIDREIAYHHRAAARGAMPEAVADELTRPLMAEREGLLARQRQLTTTAADLPDWVATAPADLLAHLAALPPGERAEWYADLYERIDLHGAAITLHHLLPLPPQSAPVPRHVREHRREQAAREALGLA